MSEGKVVGLLVDYEKRFINKLLTMESLSQIMRLGFSENFLKSKTTYTAYNIIYDYYKNRSQGELPTKEYVSEKLYNLSEGDKEIVPWEIVDEPLSIDSIIKELYDSHILNQLLDLHNDFYEGLKNRQPAQRILDSVKEGLLDIEASSISELSVKKFSDLTQRLHDYQRKKEEGDFDKGVIKFPFEKLNEHYHGIRPSNYIFILAPQKTGKTFILNEFASSAFNQKKKVLFISPEMSSDEILTRMDGFLIGTNYKKIENGNLKEDEMENWKSKVEHLTQIREEGGEIIFIDSQGDGFNVDNIRGYVEYYKPDLLIIDGITLIIDHSMGGNQQDWKVIKRTSEDIKKYICNGMGVPTIIAVQSTNDEDSVNVDILRSHNIGRAKAISQDADIIFGVSKTTEYGITKRVFNTADIRGGKKVIMGIEMDIESGRIVEDKDLTNVLVKENKDEFV